eukprot:CAMPEP_0185023104 /NCGR_PEP_ID=MMETSP1103-20130426/5795_1 /TAXON_ID=36769 /ORGANISM="Paraphysomonas bandaiensis, Strain Caron Lab Isolate" /LENGTH=69 /DNA_ID=CAMNT_0027555527 /DNA_START=73 /DNA_END=282 /DNA_ORIENTATION=+
MANQTKAKRSSAKATSEPKSKRAPSAYNIFMKAEIAKVKKANPGFDHKEAFKAAAGHWKTAKENPANNQ